jgi:hypothetical protein
MEVLCCFAWGFFVCLFGLPLSTFLEVSPHPDKDLSDGDILDGPHTNTVGIHHHPFVHTYSMDSGLMRVMMTP